MLYLQLLRVLRPLVDSIQGVWEGPLAPTDNQVMTMYNALNLKVAGTHDQTRCSTVTSYQLGLTASLVSHKLGFTSSSTAS